MGRNSKLKIIAKTGPKRREYVERKSVRRIDPAEERIGLGPYSSIQKEKIVLIKRSGENQRNRQEVPCHCLTPCKTGSSEKKRKYEKGENPSKLMLREMRM